MKQLFAFFLIVLILPFSTRAQLPNGSIAPDFTLTDLDGNTHNLYQYLDQGKVVFIKFFACHCPSCWAYHNTGTLENLYQSYGPDGSDQIQVLMLEHDEFNGDAFYGMGGYTQGDWTAGNSIPMIDVEGADRGVFTDYNMSYYPMVMKICPDKTTTLMSTSSNTAQLYQSADDCSGTLGLEEISTPVNVFVDQAQRQLVFENFAHLRNVQLFSANGQEIRLGDLLERMDLSAVKEGVYFVRMETDGGVAMRKFFVLK